MLRDVGLSLRALRREPTWALAAICTLALSIGAAASVFGVIDKVLLQPLPIDQPDRVVVMWPREPTNPATVGEFSYATYHAWQASAPGFRSLAAVGSANWSLILREGEPATIPVAAVSGSFYSTLGAMPSIGRTLGPDDDRA